MKMKKILTFALVAAAATLFCSGISFAGNNAPSGKHFQFNLIGKKTEKGNGDPMLNADISNGWDSNGRSIMIPLKTDNKPYTAEGEQYICGDYTIDDFKESGGAKYVEESNEEVVNGLPAIPNPGVKLYWDRCPDCTDFVITDRDAIDDGIARIDVPTNLDFLNENSFIQFEVWIRVRGKPMQCMEINGYAYEPTGGLYYQSGTVFLSKNKKTTFTQIDQIFDVWYCVEVETAPGSGIFETECSEKSVFDPMFQDYLWNILNDGTKNVQVRLYYPENS